MKKAGDIHKRGLATLGVIVLLASAEMETADARAHASKVPQVALVDTTSQEVKETEEPQEQQFVSIVQEGSILGRVEDTLRTVEDEMKLLYSQDCENKSEIISRLREQLNECEELENSIFCTSYQLEIRKMQEKLSAIESIEGKLAGYAITSEMDLSQVIGLSKAEIEYILLSLQTENGEHLTEDMSLAEELASAISEGAEIYGVNELFSISVMVWETGWLTSGLVQQNNFGGLRVDETGYLAYDNPKEGMIKVVSSIKGNMNGNNSAKELSEKYCRMSKEENLQWADSTIWLMKKCSEIGGGD